MIENEVIVEKIVEGMLFTNTSIIGSPPIKNLEWKVTDESNNLMAFLKNSMPIRLLISD